jgi:AAA ATPase domain
MASNEMLLLQNRLYEFLKKKHQKNINLMFDLRYNEGELGYWFSTGNHSIQTVFWGESYHCNADFDATAQKWTYTLQIENWIETYGTKLTSFGFSWRNNQVWEKVILATGDFLESLDAFLQNDKPNIDALLAHPIVGKLPTNSLRRLKQIKQIISKIETFKKSAEGTIYDQLLTEMSKPHLPFALSNLEIFDFQGIKHLIIENIPTNAQWIFLTGENSFGKTSILRAIAKGVLGDEDFVEPLPQKSRIQVSGYNWNKPFFHTTRHLGVKKTNDTHFQMATYGISRFRYHNDPDKNPPKTLALFSDDAPIINIERILIETHRAKMDGDEQGDMTTFDKLKKVFLSVIPQLSDIRVEYFKNEPITTRYQVRYYEKTEDSEIYEPIKRADLAAGYRSILSIIGDMMVRLSAHPDNSLDDLQGIVLIDEIDAHLHPKYQYELPKLLSVVFPKVQFIVSTHSPIPLLSLPKQMPYVVLTVHRTKEAGITVERLDEDVEIRRLNPNALLTSPIFGFQQLFVPDALPEQIIPTDHYEDVEFIKKMKVRIQSLREKGLVK